MTEGMTPFRSAVRFCLPLRVNPAFARLDRQAQLQQPVLVGGGCMQARKIGAIAHKLHSGGISERRLRRKQLNPFHDVGFTDGIGPHRHGQGPDALKWKCT